jgi:hypothetical protein
MGVSITIDNHVKSGLFIVGRESKPTRHAALDNRAAKPMQAPESVRWQPAAVNPGRLLKQLFITYALQEPREARAIVPGD